MRAYKTDLRSRRPSSPDVTRPETVCSQVRPVRVPSRRSSLAASAKGALPRSLARPFERRSSKSRPVRPRISSVPLAFDRASYCGVGRSFEGSLVDARPMRATSTFHLTSTRKRSRVREAAAGKRAGHLHHDEVRRIRAAGGHEREAQTIDAFVAIPSAFEIQPMGCSRKARPVPRRIALLRTRRHLFV